MATVPPAPAPEALTVPPAAPHDAPTLPPAAHAGDTTPPLSPGGAISLPAGDTMRGEAGMLGALWRMPVAALMCLPTAAFTAFGKGLEFSLYHFYYTMTTNAETKDVPFIYAPLRSAATGEGTTPWRRELCFYLRLVIAFIGMPVGCLVGALYGSVIGLCAPFVWATTVRLE